MDINNEIRLPCNPYVGRDEKLSEQFLNISHYVLLENVPEILCEWWSSTRKDLHTFLKDEGLSVFIDDKTGIDIMLGKFYFSPYFLMLIKEKMPYNISFEKLYRFNRNFKNTHKEAQLLNVDDGSIIQLLKDIYAEKKDRRYQYIRAWHTSHKSRSAEATARYRLLHPEKVRESKKKYRETHKEEIKAYKQSRREIINEQQRNRYRANIDENRKKRREYQQKFYEVHRTEILQKQAEYRREHSEEINERVKNRLKDTEYHARVCEKNRKYYKNNAVEISERKKQRRLQNLEEAKAKEQKYRKTYRDKYKDEINAKSRVRYQENLEENRKRGAEKQRKCRNKKRFRTQTGPIIFSLLEALRTRGK